MVTRKVLAAEYCITLVFSSGGLLNSDIGTALLIVEEGAKEPEEYHGLPVQCM